MNAAGKTRNAVGEAEKENVPLTDTSGAHAQQLQRLVRHRGDDEGVVSRLAAPRRRNVRILLCLSKLEDVPCLVGSPGCLVYRKGLVYDC